MIRNCWIWQRETLKDGVVVGKFTRTRPATRATSSGGHHRGRRWRQREDPARFTAPDSSQSQPKGNPRRRPRWQADQGFPPSGEMPGTVQLASHDSPHKQPKTEGAFGLTVGTLTRSWAKNLNWKIRKGSSSPMSPKAAPPRKKACNAATSSPKLTVAHPAGGRFQGGR